MASTVDFLALGPGTDGGWPAFLGWFRERAAASFLAQHGGHTGRAYVRAIGGFLAWLSAQQRHQLDRQTVAEYRGHLLARGLAPASVNQALAAVRGMVREAAHLGALDPRLAESIAAVKGPPSRGHRLGHWLGRPEAEAVINAPSPADAKGIRDRAILALLFACGLRRAEVATLAWNQVQERDGHHVIADIHGKHGRLRTVKLPVWTWRRLMAWAEVSGQDGRVFRAVHKGGWVYGEGLSPQAVYDIVAQYAGGELAPHDARRTFAKLARKGGAPLEQIQLTLGHSSVATTERYLGLELDLDANAVDFTGLSG